jgi:hypothetical protein
MEIFINEILVYVIVSFIFTTQIDFLNQLKNDYGMHPFLTDKWYLYIIYKLMNCTPCLSFWLCLGFTLSITYALLTYFVAYIFVELIYNRKQIL